MGRNSKFKRDVKKKNKPRKVKKTERHIPAASLESGPFYMELENPLTDLNETQRKKCIDEIEKQALHDIDSLTNELDEIIQKYNPLQLMADITEYGAMGPVNSSQITFSDFEKEFNQAHIELLQAKILHFRKGNIGTEVVPPAIVNDVIEILKELFQAFRISGLDFQRIECSKEQKAILSIQDFIRMNTQAVRNWGFHDQVMNISEELFIPFDDLVKTNFNFSVTSAIKVFEEMIKIIEKRVMKKNFGFKKVGNAPNKREMLKRYLAMIDEDSSVDEVIESLQLSSLSKKQFLICLYSHYSLCLSELYLFEPLVLSNITGVSVEEVENLFEHFSYSYGGLESENAEHFFLRNPVWKKPIINAEDIFYCFLPQTFFSFIFPTINQLIESIDKDKLHKRRANYLERKIEEIVKRKFPESNVVTGLKWGKYETDLIAYIDSHLIIIEAKSHQIADSGLRGSTDRIKKHFKKTIVEPSIQSRRLELKLLKLINTKKSDPTLAELPFSLDRIHKVLRLSVSLDDFASIQSNLTKFDLTGWLPPEYVKCPSFNLADFEILFDLLEHPVQIIHYLSSRTTVEEYFRISGGELDFMGLYLQTLFDLQLEEQEARNINLLGMGGEISNYYSLRCEGVHTDKPKPNTPDFFKKIFLQLEKRQTNRWTEIGVFLNKFSPREQRKISNKIKELTKIVHRNWQDPSHNNMVVYYPENWSTCSLVVCLCKDSNRQNKELFVSTAYRYGLQKESIEHCIVIIKNIDRKEEACSLIGIFEKATELFEEDLTP